MASIPSKVVDRLAAGIKRFQPIVQSLKLRDVNESDTVTVLTDMLATVFGYDKYSEITSEFAIKSTYCDLAIKVDGHVQTLIEAKSVGTELKDQHVKQAVDYAANQGIEWVVLTNAVNWRVYRVSFGKPISNELVVEFNFLELSHKSSEHLEWLFLLAREGWNKSALGHFHTQQQALSRFVMAAVLLSDPVISTVRRELRRLSPDVRIDSEQIQDVLSQEVLKRDVLEGDKAEEARRRVSKVNKAALKAKAATVSSSRTTVLDVGTGEEVSGEP